MSLPSLDIITGALLIGTWVGSLLYMVELIQAVYYFRHFKHDDWKLKTRVTVALIIDTVSVLSNYTCVYLGNLMHTYCSGTTTGDPVYLANQNWPMPLYIVATAIVAVLVQSFLLERYWRLTKNIIVTLFLGLLIIAGCGGTLACGIVVALYPAFTDRAKVKIPGMTWVVTQAAADLLIAAALLWEFKKAKTGFMETRSWLNRLAARTIQTGTVSATIAAIALMAYLLNKESNTHRYRSVTVAIGFCIGHTYVLTMLSNLNFRRSKSLSRKGATTGTRSGTQVIDSNQDFLSEQFKSKRSCVNDSSVEEIEMSSKQQSGIFSE
ncbi:hypothetical protein C8J57DRAFT_1658912 [Mycena rebaudengoi]|nr:hypothetical protein C8J57DRAFT_1658912 [Mycena rebaudengoi]